MEAETDNALTSNILIVATVDLTLATIGIMLDVFMLSEGKAGQPYTTNGRQYNGNIFFFFAWGAFFVVLLAQGLMAINLFTAASKFSMTPLRSYKKITKWQIWSVALLFILLSTGMPVFTLSNHTDELYGFVVAYLILEILFRLVAITVVEFSRDVIKRETFFLRVLPRASSMLSTNTNKSGGIPFYVKPEDQPSAPSLLKS